MLTKQAVEMSFAGGIDTKVDPKRVSLGHFLALQNSVFTKEGLLTKRNGYAALAALPNASSAYLTTLNGNLTAIGTTISAYNSGSASWVAKGTIQPMQVSTLPLIRNSINQTQADAAVASNGLVCTVYTEVFNGTSTYKYAIADGTTGQNISAPAAIPITAGAVYQSPRVFVLGNYFLITFANEISSGVFHLQYVAIPIFSPLVPGPNTDLATSYEPLFPELAWDGVVVGNNFYFAYNTTSGGQSVKVSYLSAASAASSGPPATAQTFAGRTASIMSVTADTSDATAVRIYASFYDNGTSTGYTASVDQNLNVTLAPVEIIAAGFVVNIASAAQNGLVTVFTEVPHDYGYDGAIPTDYINGVTITSTGTVGPTYVVVRSVGLASKAFIVSGVIYFLSAYQSIYQPTYFLINGSTSTEAAPVVSGKLAYENGGGYLTLGLPGVTLINGNEARVAYLYKDLVTAVNKNTAVTPGTQTAAVYSQTGVNLGTFTIGTQDIDTAEVGNDLHISGGFLWMYDGYLPVEHNFFVWPDNVEATWNTTGGSMGPQPDDATNANAYYYQVVYCWSDNQGNIFRSAPSIPVAVTTTGTGKTGTGSVTLNIPTLRLTYKTANPAKIEVYRWSVEDETYYQISASATQVNPILAPTLNDTTIDYVTVTDTWNDTSTIGNNILYTTGGVVEDVNAPASNIMTLFDTRLWLVDAEDPNLLWFSKQVIEATPVEMSDLLTLYVAPNTGTASSTGPITALAPMDDKLIIFKQDAIYYINGTGPDNTGANSQYSQPIFITSTVGCSNQSSVVLMQNGLMFQSDKGIWLVGRDLSTQYIGAPVEAFNSAVDNSAVNVPETTQIRFTLSTGVTLMYDYYYGQWGTFAGVPAISSCLFQNLHTYLDKYGRVFQESPGEYLDGSTPVLMSFTTSWFNLTGLQGYQRAFFFYLLGQYMSPHKLQLSIAYDYSSSPSQTTLITPTNFSSAVPSPYGVPSAPFGSSDDLERWRVFLARQRCQAFQITLEEVYDSTLGVPAGAGLTLSSLNLVYGSKSKFRPTSSGHSAGGGSNGSG